MVIANPIYDVVFKRLMENERVAKFFIGTLLDQSIEAIEVKPQEFTYTDTLAKLAVFRLDFIATIRTESGESRKVLIEIQKARHTIDLMRFRAYLAEQYKKDDDTLAGRRGALPITTIYLLGFRLPDIPTPCLRVQRQYHDLVNRTVLDTKSDFVEKLTHDCLVVQVDRITDRYQTRLDKLLSIFEQRHFIDDQHIIKQYKHPVDIDEVKVMTDILHHAGTEPDEKKKIEDEREAWRTVEVMYQAKAKELIEELVMKDQELTEKDKELTKTKKELTEKDEELTEKDRLIEELRRRLGNSE